MIDPTTMTFILVAVVFLVALCVNVTVKFGIRLWDFLVERVERLFYDH